MKGCLKGCGLAVVVVLAVGLTAAFFTNPDAGRHRRAVRDLAAEKHGTVGALLGGAGAELLAYESHFVFSQTRHPVNDRRVTLGFLGMVFVNEDVIPSGRGGGG